MNCQNHPIPSWVRWPLLGLATVNLILFLARFAFSGIEFRYWYDGLALAVALIVASVFILMDRRLTNLLSVLLTFPVILWFCYAALKVHGILPSSAAESFFLRDAASWREFLWTHPEILLQYVVAFIVFVVAAIYLVCSVRWKRDSL